MSTPDYRPEAAAFEAGMATTANFRTTHWSIVLLAGGQSSPESSAALERLCRTYWYPLYAFARRSGLSVDDAQDLTQGFFLHLLTKALIPRADPQRGRFRSFLLTAFKNYQAQVWVRAHAQKRGGGQSLVPFDELVAEERYQEEPATCQSPDQLYERRWAVTLVETVLRDLQAEYERKGKAAEFKHLRPFLTGEQSRYAELAAQLKMSEETARVAVFRLRQRFRDLFRGEIAQTVQSEAELVEELSYICSVLST